MRYPLVKLPNRVELALFLIMEELKSRKFFNGLQKVGLVDCSYQCNFNAPIAKYLGLDDHSDKAFRRFDDILEKHCEKIDTNDNESLMRQVLRTYVDLVIERRAQKGNKARKRKEADGEVNSNLEETEPDLRELAPFDSISIDTFADIVLRQGDKEGLEIVSNSNPENFILAIVEDRRLFITTSKVQPDPIEATVYVTYKKLNGLVVDHSGKVSSEGTVTTEKFGVVQNGSGSVELEVDALLIDLTLTKSGTLTITGSTDETRVLNTGTAHIDGSRLETTAAKVTIKDSGNVSLAVEDDLTARLDGTGCLLYSGTPRLRTLAGKGQGTLKQVEAK